jgi:hypothetical protein
VRSIRIRAASAALTAAVVLALASGCGGGGTTGTAGIDLEGATTAPTPEMTGATTPTTGATTSEDLSEAEAKQVVESMLLRLSDFPTGWRATPSEEKEGCAGIQKLSDRYDLLAHEDSKDFAQGETATASSGSGLFPDEATAKDALNYEEGAIQSEEMQRCLDKYVRENTPGDISFGEIQIGQVSFPRLGERSSAWEIVIPVQSQGINATAYVDAVYIREGRSFSVLEFSDVFSPFDESMREELARTVAKRMQTADTTPE